MLLSVVKWMIEKQYYFYKNPTQINLKTFSNVPKINDILFTSVNIIIREVSQIKDIFFIISLKTKL